jgi:ABC-2 type transport system permease protein
MKAFLALVRKDLILFRSDRRALIINLALPIFIGAFFGYLFGGSGEHKAGRIEVALVMQDTSAVSAKIGAGLKADAALNVVDLPLAEARAQVLKGKQKAAIVIPAGFGEAAGAALFGTGDKPAIALLVDPSQSAVPAMVRGMLTQQVMQAVSAEMFSGQGGQRYIDQGLAQLEANGKAGENKALRDMLASVKQFQQSAGQDAGKDGKAGVAGGGLAMPFTTSEEQVTGGDSKMAGYNGYAHSFAGMGVQFILFLGIDMGIGILLARRTGFWNRLLAAPVTLRTVLAARAASGAIIAMGILATIFVVAVLAFQVHIANVAGFVGVAACFALLTASFGLFIAAFGKTPEAARGMAVFATLIMVMLGGAWVPSFLFPEWVQTVSLAMPTRWAIDGLDAMTWRGLGMDAAFRSMAVQLGFTAVFGLLAWWKFGKEQR